jgi:Holliday junction DNA helicase RuvA
MYDFISGQLVEKNAARAVVEAAGVGYQLLISLNTYQNLPGEGQTVKLFCHLHVREDLMQLIGFSAREERTLFEYLITVSGVGPKLAMTILSGLRPFELISALQNEDERKLSSISGVGKKTAQRLIIDLKDKIKIPVLTGILPATEPEFAMNSLQEEVLMALLALGYHRHQAGKAIEKIAREGELRTVEEYIRKALQVI